MPETNLGLRTHVAPAGLLDRAVRRAAAPPPVRYPRVLAAAALFLLGIGVGRWAPSTVETPSATAPAATSAHPVAWAGRVEVPPTVPVRFVFPAGTAATVAVVGSWNGWDPLAAPMTRGEEGVFYTEIELPPGQYEYQFVVDGARWATDPSAPLAREDGFGQKNSVLTI